MADGTQAEKPPPSPRRRRDMSLQPRSPTRASSPKHHRAPKENAGTTNPSEKQRETPSRKNVDRQSRSLAATFTFAVVCAVGLASIIGRRKEMLPRAYALCSGEGSIYTVDDKSPQVECIVVYDSRILSVGSIGAYLILATVLKRLTSRAYGRRDQTPIW